MTPRRVTLVTPLHGSDGGIAVHVPASARALRRRGHAVTIVCARDELGPPGAVDVIPELGWPPAAEGLAALAGVLRDQAPDVIHVHDLAHPDVVRAAQRVGAVVTSAHAYPGCLHGNHYFAPGHECRRAHGPGCLANIALKGCAHARNPLRIPGQYRSTMLRMAAYRASDEVVGYSSAVIAHLAANGMTGQLVPYFTPAAETTSEPGVREGREVLFVGRVVPAKGLDVLLRAMVDLDATLTVVGDGWGRPALERAATRLGVSARVTFRGWLVGDDLRAAYRGANVLALPSVWPEPFGLVGLEAMAFGTPVVASMTGGVGDWLEDGVTGIGVPAGDAAELASALSRVLDDRALAARMGHAGREALDSRWGESRHVAALERVYEAALATRRAAA